ncbi:hypothetical protein BpHYR1_048227 [Brachionus plicatilis]|uniref:Uncharacterized protein n=1 Tax=Brachionus plicatilis TaxID=10195 RepID=A0A3M7QEU2_BRAPC|nr:hypothetical protein BpHYR1_048227 [Brachionus plicatilis]
MLKLQQNSDIWQIYCIRQPKNLDFFLGLLNKSVPAIGDLAVVTAFNACAIPHVSNEENRHDHYKVINKLDIQNPNELI